MSWSCRSAVQAPQTSCGTSFVTVAALEIVMCMKGVSKGGRNRRRHCRDCVYCTLLFSSDGLAGSLRRLESESTRPLPESRPCMYRIIVCGARALP